MKKGKFKTLGLQKMSEIKGGNNTFTDTKTLGSIRFIREFQNVASAETEITIEIEVEIYH